MRMDELPHAPRQDTPDTEEGYAKLRELMEQERVGREEVSTAQESPGGAEDSEAGGRRIRPPALSGPRSGGSPQGGPGKGAC